MRPAILALAFLAAACAHQTAEERMAAWGQQCATIWPDGSTEWRQCLQGQMLAAKQADETRIAGARAYTSGIIARQRQCVPTGGGAVQCF